MPDVEPHLYPTVIRAWLFLLLRQWLPLGTGLLLGLAAVLVAAMLSVFCFLWVRAQEKYEVET